MISLWIAAGAVSLAVAAMLAWPLLQRAGAAATRTDYDMQVFKDQLKEVENDRARGLLNDSEAKAAKLEIERRMLAAAETETARGAPERPAPGGWATAIAVGFIVPVAAFGLYMFLGNPFYRDVPYASRNLAAERQAAANNAGNSAVAKQMKAAIAMLEKELAKKPDELRGWVLLGRAYEGVGQYDKSVGAWKRAYALSNQRPEIGADYVEAMTLANAGRIPDSGRKLIDDIVKSAPTNLKARYFLGLGQAQQGNVKAALQTWVDLRAMSPSGAPWLPIVERQIAQAAKDTKTDPKTIEPTPEAKKLAAEIAKQMPKAPASSSGSTASTAPSSAAPAISDAQRKAVEQMTPEARQAMIRSMVDRLAKRLQSTPDDLQGWERLARAYQVLGETDKAAAAQKQVDRLRAKTK